MLSFIVLVEKDNQERMGIGGLKEKQSLIINFVLQKLGGGAYWRRRTCLIREGDQYRI